MSDVISAKLSGDSVEQVAYKLLLIVGAAEKKLNVSGNPEAGVDRAWVLDTFSECLEAAKGHRARKK